MFLDSKVKKYLKKLDRVEKILLNEDPLIREYGNAGFPGGIITLKKNIPTIIVPDLHARVYFINNLLKYEINGSSIYALLTMFKIQIVCVGDGFHSERRCRERWLLAGEEHTKGFLKHENIDKEMAECLDLMELIIDLKIEFPENFHFLKGNHENILNELGFGNYPFGKFTFEGQIVKDWIIKFYGKNFIFRYSRFEKLLPLLAVGRNFIISHAEPRHPYNRSLIVDYNNNPHIIYDLTWTGNNEADKDSVERMLENFIDEEYIDNALYFTGHRSINGLYKLRANGRLVQIHNPNRCNIVYIKALGDIDMSSAIINIDAYGDSDG